MISWFSREDIGPSGAYLAYPFRTRISMYSTCTCQGAQTPGQASRPGRDVIDDAAGLVAEHGYAGLLSRLSAVLLLRSSTGTSRRGSS